VGALGFIGEYLKVSLLKFSVLFKLLLVVYKTID